jgi:hypothetical protein
MDALTAVNEAICLRREARAALCALLPPAAHAEALSLVDLLGEEVSRYMELIATPAGDCVGLMTRGEGADFTWRAQAALRMLGMSEEALARHRALARFFEHQRGFFKVEWQEVGGAYRAQAAAYYRRRPALTEALAWLGEQGVARGPREQLARLGEAVEKETVHFLASAFWPEAAPLHKVYFSQHLHAGSQALVQRRLERALALTGVSEEARRRWARWHGVTAQAEGTLFVSARVGAQRLEPGCKLDYGEVPVERALLWCEPAARAQAQAQAQALLDRTGRAALTWLGVALRGEAPALKFYCDRASGAAP